MDATLSLAELLLGASVLVYALAGAWLVSLGGKGQWRTFLSVVVLGLIVIGLFSFLPLTTSHDGLLANWDMAFLLGGAALLGSELTLAVVLGCIARFINVQRVKRTISA